MSNSFIDQAENYIKKKKKRKRLRRTTFLSAIAVLFVTSYMLILPAITLSDVTSCGMTEHIHSPDCYMTKLASEPSCGLVEGEEHAHCDGCYTLLDPILICERQEHTHSELCYEDVGLEDEVIPEETIQTEEIVQTEETGDSLLEDESMDSLEPPLEEEVILEGAVLMNGQQASVMAIAEDDFTTSDTYTGTYGLSYTLDDLLNGYNVVSFTDATLRTHCMGAVLVAGDLNLYCSGYGDGDYLPPSYVKGVVLAYYYGKYNSRNAQNNPPLYVGSDNTIRHELSGQDWQYYLNNIVTANNGRDEVKITDDFFDFGKAQEVITQTSNTLASAGKVVSKDNSGTITINIGDNVIINDLTGVYNIQFVGDANTLKNTVVTLAMEGNINLNSPYITVRGLGDGNNTSEQGDATCVVWNINNADSVSLPSSSWVGHVVAPNADIIANNGNYNGCLIGKSVDASMEGHLHPYYGEELTPQEDVVRKLVQKVWDDNNNAAGKRPSSIQVQLYANGVVYEDAITLSSSNSWAHLWTNLPKKDASGNAIVYTVKEISAPAGYQPTYSEDTFTITNKVVTMENTTIVINKKWYDVNGDLIVHNTGSVTFDLYRFASGTPPSGSTNSDGMIPTGAEHMGTYTISSSDNWSKSFECPKVVTASDGTLTYYTYYVKEREVTNYETSYENNGTASGTILIHNKEIDNVEVILPNTGGIGYLHFYALGGMLCALAGILIGINRIIRRRKLMKIVKSRKGEKR